MKILIYVFLYLIENKIIRMQTNEKLIDVKEQMEKLKKEINFLLQFKKDDKK